ncbi:MAG: hydantoinase/oxoprolinase family protein [Candidatus Hodarchaeota archaeon]
MKVGIEIGGTFTDLISISDHGKVKSLKVESTPSSPEIGAIKGLTLLVGEKNIKKIKELFHGSTVATNTVLERKGAVTGLITTKNFRDVLLIARQDRKNVYDMFYQRPQPVVSREKIVEVTERINSNGNVLTPLDEKEAEVAIDTLVNRYSVNSIAVSLLHSYKNPIHEISIKKIINTRYPHVYVTLSSETLPEFREYERTSTIALHAYMKPIIAQYLEKFENKLFSLNYKGPLFIMQSNGGVLPSTVVRQHPAQMFLSGPTAGVTGATFLSRKCQMKNLITVDIGGTSADVCLVSSGEAETTTEGEIDGLPIRIPMIDVVTVGAGGGSIVWIDPGEMLRVGPHSAGAVPGPACYRKGGTNFTLTDAFLMLGLIRPDRFLGGKLKLSHSSVRESLKPLTKKLNMNPFEISENVFKIAISNVSQAMRLVSVERGYDPRDYILCCYGGAGPLNAAYLADALNIEKAIIPLNPGIFSAFGLLASNIKMDYVQTEPSLVSNISFADIKKIYEKLENRAFLEFRQFHADTKNITFIYYLDMRYVGQGYELRVQIDLNDIKANVVEKLNTLFHHTHKWKYGHFNKDEDVQIMNYRLSAMAMQKDYFVPKYEIKKSVFKPEKGEIYLNGESLHCEIIDRSILSENVFFSGPILITEDTSTTLIPPGWKGWADGYGNINLEKEL